MEQELLSISEYLSSPLICVGFHVARSLVFCLISCRPLFIILFFCFWSLYCLSFDLGLLIIPLVSSNILGRDKSYFLFVFVFCNCFFVFTIAFVFVFCFVFALFFVYCGGFFCFPLGFFSVLLCFFFCFFCLPLFCVLYHILPTFLLCSFFIVCPFSFL